MIPINERTIINSKPSISYSVSSAYRLVLNSNMFSFNFPIGLRRLGVGIFAGFSHFYTQDVAELFQGITADMELILGHRVVNRFKIDYVFNKTEAKFFLVTTNTTF